MFFDGVEVLFELVDRSIDVDRGNARAHLIQSSQNISEQCESPLELGMFARGYVDHYEFPSRATRRSTLYRLPLDTQPL